VLVLRAHSIRRELREAVPLIASRQPVTARLHIMIEGSGTTTGAASRRCGTRGRICWHRILRGQLRAQVTDYLKAQIEAGIRARMIRHLGRHLAYDDYEPFPSSTCATSVKALAVPTNPSTKGGSPVAARNDGDAASPPSVSTGAPTRVTRARRAAGRVALQGQSRSGSLVCAKKNLAGAAAPRK